MDFDTLSRSKRSKRALSDDESEGETHSQINQRATVTFARFIVVQAVNKDKPITSLSPFVIEKQISSILGTPKSIKNLRNGTLLVECRTKQQADNLLGTSSFFGLGVKVFAHQTLNSSKGVVRCPEISDTPLEEIKSQMLKEGVTDVKRISIRKNGKEIHTNTYVFTFNTPSLPPKVKIAYHIKNVEVFVPNPLRCYKCQKFGHHEDGCKAQVAVCGRCAEPGHNFRDCVAEQSKCANCHEEHQSHSRNCSFWKKEKEILRIKHCDNVSFTDARSIFEQRNKLIEKNNSNLSYANIAKPKQTECETCKVLVEKLCLLFPDKAAEIRQLVQSQDNDKVSAPQTTDQPTQSGEHTQSTGNVSDKKEAEKQSQTTKTQNVQKEKQKTLKESKQNTDKEIKQRASPKKKINLPSHSISKKSSTDTTSSEKKNRITRLEVTEEKVTLRPIPTSTNQYETLAVEEMEEDDTPLNDRFNNPPENWYDPKDPDSWKNAHS